MSLIKRIAEKLVEDFDFDDVIYDVISRLEDDFKDKLVEKIYEDFTDEILDEAIENVNID